MDNNKETDVLKSLPIKLRESTRKRFKEITRNRGSNMQVVLGTFVESYIENPDKFKIRMEVVNNG